LNKHREFKWLPPLSQLRIDAYSKYASEEKMDKVFSQGLFFHFFFNHPFFDFFKFSAGEDENRFFYSQ